MSHQCETYTTDLIHDITSKLFTADAMLKTSEEKKNVFAATPAFVSTSNAVVWIIEAVTAEKNVAIVVMSKYLDDLDF